MFRTYSSKKNELYWFFELGITFVSPNHLLIDQEYLQGVSLWAIRGDYFMGVFCVNENGEYYLLEDSWGGLFDASKHGGRLQKLNSLYTYTEKSNNVAEGTDYAIVKVSDMDISVL